MPFGEPRRAAAKPSCTFTLALGLLALVGCQTSPLEDVERADAPIVDGTLDTTHKGVVSLLKAVQGGYFPSCTGTLLTPNLVLTAQHCVASLTSADGASVECDTTEFRAPERASSLLVSVEANVGRDGLSPYPVAQVWVPPGSRAVCGNDMALLLLGGAGVPASRATPIEPTLDRELGARDSFSAIGYGLQVPTDQIGETAGHRMIATTGQVYCQGTACRSDKVLDGEFIADSPVCSGDSGGPALDDDGRVTGVTSRGDAQCSLGIYSNVAAWKDFIVEKTRVAATSGGYAVPAWAGGSTAGAGGTASGDAGASGSPLGGSSAVGGGGVVIAGGPSSPATGGSASPPIVDPLGLTCTGECPGAYVCWAATGQPPGICVPKCSAEQPACPDDFVCEPELSACIRPADLPKSKTSQSGGCSVTTAPNVWGSPVWVGWLVAAVVLGRRRARQRR